METYKRYQNESMRKLVRNHIYEKLDEILKYRFSDNKEREKIVDEIYRLFAEMV